MALSFRGGLKLSRAGRFDVPPMESMKASDAVTLPLSQQAGEACVPLVAPGDRVLKGQKIASPPDDSAPLFASVSGRVLSIGTVATDRGEAEAIVLENDHKGEVSPDVRPFSSPISRVEPEELVAHIREKGIVDADGVGAPVWKTIEAARDKAQRLVIHCIESEPYLSAAHRLLLDKTEEVIGGAKILLRAIGCKKAVFAIGSDTEDAVEAVQNAVGGSESFGVAVFRDKFPQSDERFLLRALIGKELKDGLTPADLGAVVFRAETCWAVYRAFVTGLPMIERLIAVGGDCVKHPACLVAPLGVRFSEMLSRCGGCSSAPDRLFSGGPLTGLPVADDTVPLTRLTRAVLALRLPEPREESGCIRCGRCVSVCPMRLMPVKLWRAVKNGNYTMCEVFHLEACTQCGLCTVVCPAGIPLSDVIAAGKAAFLAAEGGDRNA